MQFSNMGSHVWSEFACVFRLGSSGLKLKSPNLLSEKSRNEHVSLTGIGVL